MLKDYCTYLREENTEFMKNEGIMYAVLKKYGLYNRRDDYIDVCYIGYTKAINNYDEAKGKLHNYIYNCVENELLTELRKENAVKRQRTECSADHVYDTCGASIYDIVADDIDLEADLIRKENNDYLHKAILKLSEQEQMIINSLFGLTKDIKTQAEVCRELNTNPAKVNQIKNKALAKLREMLGDIR